MPAGFVFSFRQQTVTCFARYWDYCYCRVVPRKPTSCPRLLQQLQQRAAQASQTSRRTGCNSDCVCPNVISEPLRTCAGMSEVLHVVVSKMGTFQVCDSDVR